MSCPWPDPLFSHNSGLVEGGRRVIRRILMLIPCSVSPTAWAKLCWLSQQQSSSSSPRRHCTVPLSFLLRLCQVPPAPALGRAFCLPRLPFAFAPRADTSTSARPSGQELLASEMRCHIMSPAPSAASVSPASFLPPPPPLLK